MEDRRVDDSRTANRSSPVSARSAEWTAYQSWEDTHEDIQSAGCAHGLYDSRRAEQWKATGKLGWPKGVESPVNNEGTLRNEKQVGWRVQRPMREARRVWLAGKKVLSSKNQNRWRKVQIESRLLHPAEVGSGKETIPLHQYSS